MGSDAANVHEYLKELANAARNGRLDEECRLHRRIHNKVANLEAGLIAVTKERDALAERIARLEASLRDAIKHVPLDTETVRHCIYDEAPPSTTASADTQADDGEVPK